MVLKGTLGCGSIKDVVRGTILCADNATVVKVLKSLSADNDVMITNVKDGYATYKEGDWIDVKLIVYMEPTWSVWVDVDGVETQVEQKDYTHHKCEIQIVHQQMMRCRKEMGGHHAYSNYRSLGELIDELKDDQGGEEELRGLQMKIKGLLEKNRTAAIMTIARACTDGLMSKIEDDGKIAVEIASLNAQLAELIANKNFAECVIVQQRIHELQHQELPKVQTNLDLAVGKGVKIVEDGEDPTDLSYLKELYPSFPLSAYVNDGRFWHINKKYKGLQCVSKEPFVFLVPNLLTPEECKNLIIKGGNHFGRSKTSGNIADPNATIRDTRTSWDVRVPFDEVPKIQSIFSDVLNVPVSQFEPLKLIRYKDGQQFKPHHDSGGAQHLAPRVITLFVYLNNCDGGGETHFTKLGLKIKPRAGLGVIHFPARLSTAKETLSTEYEVGAKVQILPPRYTTMRHGTVTRITGKKGALWKDVTVEEDGTGKSFTINGNINQLQKQIPLMTNIGGVRDERLRHAGMPAVGEKFLASQWVFEEKVEASALMENYGVTPLDGGVL
jgi:prolyl 4-hydroxylase